MVDALLARGLVETLANSRDHVGRKIRKRLRVNPDCVKCSLASAVLSDLAQPPENFRNDVAFTHA